MYARHELSRMLAAILPRKVAMRSGASPEVLEERQRWISKREEALERKEKLQKLLQLQDPTDSNIEQRKPKHQRQQRQTARKKELKELQARAEAAREKHQAAAIVLARSLKQLQAKRKREEKEADEHPRKKVDVGSKDEVKAAVTPEMHSVRNLDGFLLCWAL
ncbi:hypothetical protein GQ600_23786 [Phytophthora cactorum]|nr:hypothetical protein GQ600_23786 [Phytophthora cactorum]